MKTWWAFAVVAAAVTVGLAPVRTEPAPAGGAQASSPKTSLYLVATAHLDSQWNWTVQDTIRDHIPKTFHTNFDFFEKYPNYVFSWEGAIHYMWFKEYHPDEWARVQQYVASGRWRLAGSWIDAVDVNMPSPESLFRQALYAERFFRQEFNGKESHDVYLPDCFGFGFALPSIAAHSGLVSFSTQKLTWGRPIPFPIGRWRGVDGSEIIAELSPGSYTTSIRDELTPATTNGGRADAGPWLNDPTPIGNNQQLEFRYFGTGDTGGGPSEASVQFVNKALANPDPALAIKNVAPDQLARDLTPAERAALPVYNDELILKTHGTGCYTSQAAMKRFNRTNELLADAAEKSGVAASVLTGEAYPSDRLREAWIRFIWHQFHDDLTGTCIPQAYQFSWNDELASMNQFAGVLTSSTSAVSSLLDTTGAGVPLVVYNPVSMERTEPIEATVKMAAAASVKIVDASTGEAVPAQVLGSGADGVHVLFLGAVPSLGFKVFTVSPSTAAAADSSLKATASSLENNRLSVRIDQNGDIASIYDKEAKHELLRAPIMLELRDNPSPDWPAWEVLYDTVNGPAREFAANPTIRVIERGPVRAALEITRHAAGSTFVEHVRLAEGGDRVDVENLVDWRSPNTELKASFPFAASNPKATYDLGLGTIERTNNDPDKYEVPAQKWAGIDDVSGTFGVGVINDSKYGWDKPSDSTLRLTLLHTPRPNTGYTYQSSNDLGHHRFVYAIAGHSGDWRQGRLPVRATALNQPVIAFQTTAHAGPIGRVVSLAWLASPNGGANIEDSTGEVAIVAMKKAEDSDEVIVRLQERYGRPVHGLSVRLGVPILGAREVNAAEEDVGPFALPVAGNRGRGGAGAAPGGPPPAPTNFTIDLKPYQPRAIALKLQPAWEAFTSARALAEAQAAAPAGRGGGGGGRGAGGPAPLPVPPPQARHTATVTLPFNLDGVSTDAARGDGDFDGKKHTIAAELLPARLTLDGVPFTFGSGAPGQKNVLVPAGQTIALPDGFNRLYLLAAAIGGDVPATMTLGPAASRTITVRDWQGPVGQWWSRLKENAPALHEPFVPAGGRPTPSQQEIQAGLVVQWDPKSGRVSGIDQIRPAFVKRDEIAWIGTHRHDPTGNEPYVSSYVFAYAIDMPPGTTELRLPPNDRIRILAATVSSEANHATPAGAIYMADFADSYVVPPSATAPAREKPNAGGKR